MTTPTTVPDEVYTAAQMAMSFFTQILTYLQNNPHMVEELEKQHDPETIETALEKLNEQAQEYTNNEILGTINPDQSEDDQALLMLSMSEQFTIAQQPILGKETIQKILNDTVELLIHLNVLSPDRIPLHIATMREYGTPRTAALFQQALRPKP